MSSRKDKMRALTNSLTLQREPEAEIDSPGIIPWTLSWMTIM